MKRGRRREMGKVWERGGEGESKRGWEGERGEMLEGRGEGRKGKSWREEKERKREERAASPCQHRLSMVPAIQHGCITSSTHTHTHTRDMAGMQLVVRPFDHQVQATRVGSSVWYSYVPRPFP